MTRPHIIRADTIDLQGRKAPSAKDHARSLASDPSSLAPHQAETLREVAQEAAEENAHSPRVSWSHSATAIADLQQHAEDISSSAANTHGPDASHGYGHGDGDSDGDWTASDATMQQQQRDSLAVAQNGGLSGHIDESDADADTDDSFDDDMDKMSTSPPIEDDDIDFDFVYALHTFVATVEGQANATKGDNMVLLDDSNSYWWLVRVAKDSSIGYLPAEHIETPTERLARYNKHRNADLSATMLGDQMGEKSKSTFRTALRGKKKKTVAFAEPTYVNYSYSDMDYSSEEEDVDEPFGAQAQNSDQGETGTDTWADGDEDSDALDHQQKQQQQDGQGVAERAQQHITEDAMMDETARVEPLKPKAHKELVAAAEPSMEVVDEEDDEDRLSSEQLSETKPEGPSRSRNGTVRNTDSFFKDETVETKKITLTPNLLRDDTNPRPSNESKELKQRPSLDKMEKMEKELQPDNKKEDRKKKDKKSSTIRSFFSRKDKKRSTDEDDDSFGKRSMDAENEHDEDRSDARHASPEKSGPQRQPSKLQKQQPRTEPSPTRRPGSAAQKSTTTRDLSDYIVSETRNDVSNVPPASMRIVQEQQEKGAHSPVAGQLGSEPVRPGSSHKEDRSGLSKMKLSRSAGGEKQNKVEKPQKVVKAKSRIELDDFDSTDEETTKTATDAQQAPDQPTQEETAQRPVLPGAYPDSFASGQNGSSNKQGDDTAAETITKSPGERLSESPVQVSPFASNDPPALMGDTSSEEDASSKSASPELVDTDEAAKHAQDSMTTSSTSTTNSQGSSWNDAKLRAFFDSSADIRDMLVVVYDKSDVVPAGPDHPLVGTLFREQNAKLAEITTQLDNMLGDWLARKQRLRGTV
ncbi:hypothetical protein ACRALDRAFT_1059374 [Sodiomyces alcalophilus JCM 7366]|uniref:uncharacterized protein n=1 Tax=Sodiomyces alcalophilus JCM 7366 TaxID=591952 RepID=UPI0039B3D1A1